MVKHPIKSIEHCYCRPDAPDSFGKAVQAAIDSLYGNDVPIGQKTKSAGDLQRVLLTRLKLKQGKLPAEILRARRVFVRALIDAMKVHERLTHDLKDRNSTRMPSSPGNDNPSDAISFS